MKNKKIVLALIALVAVLGLMVGVWFGTRPQENGNDPSDGASVGDPNSGSSSSAQFKYSFTVIVVHADGTEKTFEYQTNEEKLGPVLKAEGLIEESASPGLYDVVDGEKADWDVDQSYWSFYIGEESALQGMNDTQLTDGAVYKLVYTK